jgi:hypothetical protein
MGYLGGGVLVLLDSVVSVVAVVFWLVLFMLLFINTLRAYIKSNKDRNPGPYGA